MIAASLEDIAVAGEGNQFLALLKTESGSILPIVIDAFQAISISMGRNGDEPGRPMTHDLILSMIELFGAKVARIEITDIVEGVYLSMLVIERQGVNFEIDARPSDALAVAVRVKAPILIAEHVVDENALADAYGGNAFEA
jgi:bifunctional DNase/RNase